MEIEIVLIVAGIMSIFGVFMYITHKNREDPFKQFIRGFAARRQLVAVHTPDGKVTFKTYEPNHAEAENYMSEKEHYRNLLISHTQTIGNAEITQIMSDPLGGSHVYGNGGGYVWTAGGNRAREDIITPMELLTELTQEPDKPVVTEQVVVQHKPGDRFLDIVGE